MKGNNINDVKCTIIRNEEFQVFMTAYNEV